MSLSEQLKKDIVAAMKGKEEMRLSVLRMAKAALQLKEVEKMRPLDETESIQLLQTLAKQRKESIDQFGKGGRQDLVDKETSELKILESYLPAGASDAEMDAAIVAKIEEAKLVEEWQLLQTVPGIQERSAASILAETGADMEQFPSPQQLSSWAGVCPGNNESAGKRKSSRIPKGNVYLKTALVEAANSAAKAKGTYLRDKFYRLKARRGYKRAAVAVAHKIMVAIYHMLSHRVCYNELGDAYLDKRNKHQLTRNLIHRLERLGYSVTLEQKAA